MCSSYFWAQLAPLGPAKEHRQTNLSKNSQGNFAILVQEDKSLKKYRELIFSVHFLKFLIS